MSLVWGARQRESRKRKSVRGNWQIHWFNLFFHAHQSLSKGQIACWELRIWQNEPDKVSDPVSGCLNREQVLECHLRRCWFGLRCVTFEMQLQHEFMNYEQDLSLRTQIHKYNCFSGISLWIFYIQGIQSSVSPHTHSSFVVFNSMSSNPFTCHLSKCKNLSNLSSCPVPHFLIT